MTPKNVPSRIGLFWFLVLLICLSPSAHGADVLAYATDKRDAWQWRYHVWTALHYGLGLSSVIAGVVAGTFKKASVSQKSALALIAAITAGILTFVNPSPTAKAFHRAWTDLDGEIVEYQNSPIPNKEALKASVDNGEKLLRESGVL